MLKRNIMKLVLVIVVFVMYGIAGNMDYSTYMDAKSEQMYPMYTK